jgi:hypothetical protein
MKNSGIEMTYFSNPIGIENKERQMRWPLVEAKVKQRNCLLLPFF